MSRKLAVICLLRLCVREAHSPTRDFLKRSLISKMPRTYAEEDMNYSNLVARFSTF
jgi:hypothetical protein